MPLTPRSMFHASEPEQSEEKDMAQAAQTKAQISNRKAMMVVLNLPCFSRNRCAEGKKGAKAYKRREKHQGRSAW
jgi:stalled ribosome alternative rescue factor ArfA